MAILKVIKVVSVIILIRQLISFIYREILPQRLLFRYLSLLFISEWNVWWFADEKNKK